MSSKKNIITVTLNPAIDKIVRTRDFVLAKTTRVDEAFYSAGGKGINVSRALKALGIKSIAAGFLGGPSGEFIKETLKKEGIKANFVDIPGETRTSLAIIDTKNKQTTRILEEGPVVKKKDIVAFKKQFRSLLRNCQYVVISGRNISGSGDAFCRELINIAKRQGAQTVLDTSGEPLRLGVKAAPFLIKPNLAEAEFVLQEKLNTLTKKKKAVRFFLDFGIQNVIISFGKKGCIAANKSECWLAEPPKIKVISTVGSGDALIGGFLYAFISGNDFPEAIKIAIATGSANTLNLQPGHFSKTKVMHLARRVKLTKL